MPSLRTIKHRVTAAMANTVVISLRVPHDLTVYQAYRLLQSYTKNSIRFTRAKEGKFIRAAADLAPPLATQTPPCRGTACGTTTGEHSAECVAEHARAVAGLPRSDK